MGRRTRWDRVAVELLERVYEAEHAPRELAESLGLSLGELAWLARERETVGALRGLRRLADTQTQLMVSRYRLTAAAKLVGLAHQEEDGELARRACVDLLKLDLMPEPRRAAAARKKDEGEAEPAEGLIDETKVLAALERLGREKLKVQS